jgi:beta-carotene 3-hydroxylase
MISLFITLGVFVLMEGVTWCTHKYVMHGFMWYFHDDHHNPHHGHFEKNDFFFVIFAVPSFLLILFGAKAFDVRFFIGLGIMFYGAGYFLVHDVLIHQRFKWFTRTDNIYFRALRKAHKVHHKHLGKEDGECFGMLFVPRKYFVEAMKYKKNLTRV